MESISGTIKAGGGFFCRSTSVSPTTEFHYLRNRCSKTATVEKAAGIEQAQKLTELRAYGRRRRMKVAMILQEGLLI